MRSSRLALAAIAILLAAATAAEAAPGASRSFRIEPGSTGQHVRDLQWLLAGHKPAVFQYGFYKGKITGRLNEQTARALKNTKWRLGYPANAAKQPVATDLFFRIITKKVTRPLSWRIAAGNRANRATPFPEPSSVPAKTRTLVDDAEHLIARAPLVHYSQRTRMQIVRLRLRLPPLTRQIWEDCSSAITGLYWLAKLADPNGRRYDGFGYTGTLKNFGRVVWRLGQPLTLLKPGDVIFYGRGTFSHATLYLDRGRVFSHGSEGGPFNLPVLYRGDAYYARRYVGGI